ncbi:MAG: type II toxin-antitoxin system RatA family toxin [Woeseiaceae bacterium]|nr:type II toxin-antitoxin system RatA family toxin [Woeseiaceae bacterium]
MRSVRRSALVPYSAEQMFRLVDDIESYPSFLPWCTDARIVRRDGTTVEATLEMSRAGLTRSFTTRNRRSEFDSIDLALAGGPFRHLEGTWRFQALREDACKVTLDLDFEFESRVLDMMLGAFFEETCNSLVDAFTRRAAAVYVD